MIRVRVRVQPEVDRLGEVRADGVGREVELLEARVARERVVVQLVRVSGRGRGRGRGSGSGRGRGRGRVGVRG